MTAREEPGPPGGPMVRTALLLAAGAFVALLDTTVVGVALESFARRFGAGPAQVQWVATAYLLAMSAVIPATGWAARRFGAVACWTASLAVFLLGSVLCGLAWSLVALVAFRVVQGLGAGMLFPLMRILVVQVAGPRRMGRMMALIAAPVLLAPLVGPVVGGALVQGASWRWVFLLNVPVCLAVVVLSPLLMRNQRGDGPGRLDVAGLVTVSGGLTAAVLGFARLGGGRPAGDPGVLVPLLAAAGLLVAHGVLARRRPEPGVVDFGLFRDRAYAASTTVSLLNSFGLYGAVVLVPLFFQQAGGRGPLATGLIMVAQGRARGRGAAGRAGDRRPEQSAGAGAGRAGAGGGGAGGVRPGRQRGARGPAAPRAVRAGRRPGAGGLAGDGDALPLAAAGGGARRDHRERGRAAARRGGRHDGGGTGAAARLARRRRDGRVVPHRVRGGAGLRAADGGPGGLPARPAEGLGPVLQQLVQAGHDAAPGAVHLARIVEAAVGLDADEAVEGGAQQADGVGQVGLVQAVVAHHRVGEFDRPGECVGAGEVGRFEAQLGGGVAAGVLLGVRPVGVGEGGEGVGAGAAGDGGRDAVVDLLGGEQGDPGADLPEALDVRVEAGVLDAEAAGELGGGDLVDADAVGEFGGGAGDPVDRQASVRAHFPRSETSTCRACVSVSGWIGADSGATFRRDEASGRWGLRAPSREDHLMSHQMVMYRTKRGRG
ncbi:hypothetical protein KCH_22890 [Kitasatospora cheerisanensis KCTC 2395]|uniref:Major facilitator superfamily (MFS) profile domain-containing protein n=1 Tax=Kitasatospora cheerisanensis KCTC 2395 TaxID=1348663 RepID=A0A066YWG5_9ACTN|nr:hypothetical protein KCH_22890 [Kitasatospora cheerisanensis KCTC 2395]